MTSPVNHSSARYYATEDAVDEYIGLTSLWKPEQVLFERHRAELAGDVLDLGMGAGRTSAHLIPEARSYVGVDYSPVMVEACRQKFPGGDFREGDAGDLAMFDNDSFDAVVFSFNGIDCADHDTRLRILSEVRRVLRPGGRFIFSFHSRDARHRIKAVRFRNFRPTADWARTTIRGVSSYLRVRKQQVTTDTYEIMSDPEGCYGCMAYFITKPEQTRQLSAAGFEDIQLVNFGGTDEPIDTLDRESFWFYVSCTVGEDDRAEQQSGGS